MQRTQNYLLVVRNIFSVGKLNIPHYFKSFLVILDGEALEYNPIGPKQGLREFICHRL
jgi:hypothetical protein